MRANRLRHSRVPAITWLLIAATSPVLAGCGAESPGQVTPTPGGRLSVVASFYPIQFFAERIGGDKAGVYNPVPVGAEPHDLELTPRDLERIKEARVFLYLGEGFQPAVDRALATIQMPTLLAADVGKGIPRLTAEGTQEAGGSNAASPDPHIWLDPADAQQMSANIVDAFSTADPANAPSYRSNGNQLRADLAALDKDFRQGLQNCSNHQIVTSHAAFEYLAARYGLQQLAIAGLSPENEPTPRTLERIIDFVKQQHVKYIFYETLVDPRIADLVARETGTQTLVLNPIEGLTAEQQAAGENYFTIMRENLKNLELALGCK